MKSKQTVLGILIILAGVATFLVSANVSNTRELAEDWWPVAIIIAGLYMWWSNARNYIWSVITVLVGAALLLSTLDVVDVNAGMLIGPAILVGLGLNMIALSMNRSPAVSKSDDDIAAILGGSSSKNTSSDYQGGSVTAFMGGVEVDLSKATIQKSAVLKVMVIMGGIELRLPENVAVINRTQAFLGGTEDKTTASSSRNTPTITIEGMVVMGGIEIKR